MKFRTSRITVFSILCVLSAATLVVVVELVHPFDLSATAPFNAFGSSVATATSGGAAPADAHTGVDGSSADGSSADGSRVGYASWYGPYFQGRLTASGEVFDTNEFTAAHRSLPFNSIVKVTNLENGRSVIVRINDRGPYVSGRMIDLTHADAAAIGMIGDGVVKVRLDILHRQEPTNLRNLQVAAFAARSDAELLRRQLDDLGLDSSVQKNSEGAYRVVLMGIPNENIPTLQKRLREMGYANTLVRIS